MNKIILTGRVTKDIVKTTAGTTTVAKFSIAVARDFKKGESDFINCVAFGKTADTIEQYFTKGKPIGLTGRIQTGSYEKDGRKIYTTDVVVESFEFVLKDSSTDTDMIPDDGGDIPF